MKIAKSVTSIFTYTVKILTFLISVKTTRVTPPLQAPAFFKTKVGVFFDISQQKSIFIFMKKIIINDTPKYLYHGSIYNVKILKPSYYITGELSTWDGTEDNKSLYATTKVNVAIEQAFASYLEQKHNLKLIQINNNNIILTIPKNEKINFDFDVFIYQIIVKKEDNWVKVNNQFNNLNNEYKTEKQQIEYVKKQKVSISTWVEDKKIRLLNE